LCGKKRAKKISFFSGTTIIYAISWFTLPWVSPVNYFDWLLIMLGLDIYMGIYVFKFKWSKIIEDKIAKIAAVLDLRRDPKWIQYQLNQRRS
jgi:hypothetical protein